MISYIVPTRDRPQRLADTLEALGRLSGDDHGVIGGAEIIIVDNASAVAPVVPRRLTNGLSVRLITRPSNEGAAGRNAAVKEAGGEWVVMLDDDSHPLDATFVEALLAAPGDVAAIGADITLPDGRREAGGLPEVFVGCGVAIRREAFLAAGGYDPSFHYYAEEYDLCAKLLLGGWRIVYEPRFRVVHEKTAAGRDMDLIVARLVRNNGWVAQRYAPAASREDELCEVIRRYADVAVRERAAPGYARGVAELLATLPLQPRRVMEGVLFDRFTGLAHARESLRRDRLLAGVQRVAMVDEGKNAWAVRQALSELGVEIGEDEQEAEVVVIGTLSPGPMQDAWERRTALGQGVVRPWALDEARLAARC